MSPAKKTARRKTKGGARMNVPAAKYRQRADKGAPIEGFVAKLEGTNREIADAMVSLIRRAVPKVISEIKWGMPVFSHHGMLCYLRPAAGYVRFGFTTHPEALEPHPTLEGEGPNGRHVRIQSRADIDAPRFTRWLKAIDRAAKRDL